ncbi:MAG: hypothetical protein AAB580_00540, partial [Patescibacteria group bacterium]
MVEKCVYNLSLSLAIIQKKLDKSFSEGLVAVKAESLNLYTAVKEWFVPKQARFDEVVKYEYKDGKMYWQGDSMPTADHLRRFTLLQELQGVSPDWISQAKKDQQVFDVIQDQAKNLKPGQAIQYLSKKDPDPNKGVSLQQIVNDNGVLKHQSHLLPFDDINQINKFISLASDDRKDLSLDDDVSGWIVIGDKIDFDQNLPKMIIGSMLSEKPLVDWQQPLISAWPQLISTSNLDLSSRVDRVVSVEPSSFWWQVLAVTVREERFDLVDQEKVESVVPTRTDLVGKLVEVEKPILVSREGGFWFEAMAVQSQEPIFTEPEVLQSTLEPKQEWIEPVKKEEMVLILPTRTDLVVKKEAKREVILRQELTIPTRTDLVG